MPITAPTDLHATAVTANQVDLAWTASTASAGVASYTVFRDGTQVGAPTTPAYADTGLAASTSYTYTIVGVDTNGVASAPSAPLNVTTAAGGGGPDIVPPTVPTGLASTTVTQTSVSLAWTASTDNVAVTGYKIFRNNTQVGVSGVASFTDSGLTPATAYTYKVSAVDAGTERVGTVAAVDRDDREHAAAARSGPGLRLQRRQRAHDQRCQWKQPSGNAGQRADMDRGPHR